MTTRRLLSLLLAVLLAAPFCFAAEFDPDPVVRDVETGFRAFMEHWGYDQHWSMWELGTGSSRTTVSQREFADRIRMSTIKPAAGKQVEAIQVFPQSATRADLQVRFSLEHHKQHRIRTFTVSTTVVLEDGAWRFDLQDFLPLTQNQAWY
jgi:hypothetical protein